MSRDSFALRLLQSVRDEAHRFAQAYHHTLRRQATFGEGEEGGVKPKGRRKGGGKRKPKEGESQPDA